MSHLPDRPLFLSLLALFSFFQAVFIPIWTIGLFLADPNSTIVWNEEQVLIRDLWSDEVGKMVAWWPIPSVLTYAIWGRKKWARQVCAAFCLLLALWLGVIGIMRVEGSTIAVSIAMAILVWWYFFRKANVVEYFGAA